MDRLASVLVQKWNSEYECENALAKYICSKPLIQARKGALTLTRLIDGPVQKDGTSDYRGRESLARAKGFVAQIEEHFRAPHSIVVDIMNTLQGPGRGDPSKPEGVPGTYLPADQAALSTGGPGSGTLLGNIVTRRVEDRVDSLIWEFCAARRNREARPSDGLDLINLLVGNIQELIQGTSEISSNDYSPDGLLERGRALFSQFESTGAIEELNEAVACWKQALAQVSEPHTCRPGILVNLLVTYTSQFELFGNIGDLDEAMRCGLQAISSIPDDCMDKSNALNGLGVAHRMRFRHLGEVIDLDKAISYGLQANACTPTNHTARPSILSHLAVSYRIRFRRLHELVDLNKAIDYGAQAVLLTPSGDPNKPGTLINLGTAYRARFERLGEPLDLNKLIECAEQATLLTPGGHVSKHGALNNLGNAYLIRFANQGNFVDLSKAISCAEYANSLVPDGHVDKLATLTSLGDSYMVRFEHLGDLVDLVKAINHKEEAVQLAHNGHTDKPNLLANLASAYLSRFETLGLQGDLNWAISCGMKVISLLPDDHPERSARLRDLGLSYWTRYRQLHIFSDVESAVDCLKQAARLNSGPPSARFHACRDWARMASHRLILASYPAYHQAMELLPRMVWIGATISRRYSLVAGIEDFTMEAVAHAIRVNSFEVALEWLEAGRSIIWSQRAQLRTPFDHLSRYDPGLAGKLKGVGRRLELASAQYSFPGNDTLGLTEGVSGHIQLALDWEILLNRARSIPGFEEFLRPPTFRQLLGVARAHPIAIINVHKSRCDALILRPNYASIGHVPLTGFSAEKADQARKHLVSLVGCRGFVRANKPTPGSIEDSLKEIWLGVVKPVLDFLGYTYRLPTERLPRLTWCTTGALSFLPLHAAGLYDHSHPNAFDLVVSSYSPTLGALLAGQENTPGAGYGLLAIGQENTPGFESLPYVKDELAIIQDYSQENSYHQLANNEATVGNVLDAMDRFSWVHMACHGSQGSGDPTKSAFQLHDGSLTLATITKQSFRNKGLAFLSACQTATGDKEMPDEAIHLAAGMLMAGYPSVIGTMWGISDQDGPTVAGKVYAELLKDGKMDHTGAARALHKAVLLLRDTIGEKAIARWAPFVHIGS